MSDDDTYFDELGVMLVARGHWRYEPSATPGQSPSWCLDPGGQVTLSVNVYDGAVLVYAPADDREFRVEGIDALRQWLDVHEAEFLV